MRISDWSSDVCSSDLSQASNFAIIVDPDFTATLYIDCLNVSLEMVAKRAVEAGEAVWSNDIGDIYRGSITFPKLRRDQHFIICLRHAWKFLLICCPGGRRSEEPTSELHSLIRISYAGFCLEKKKKYETHF